MNGNIGILGQTTVLHEILKWSTARPNWQRDALRRILENGSILDGDLLELERICRASHQIDTSADPLVVVPLAQSHLPAAPGVTESVSLVSIGDLKNVNRLSSNQTIPFGDEIGLTVVYGENGAGKSGYARVIKKACRARGAQPIIRPNAFTVASASTASAKIIFKVGGADVESSWTDGVSADARLANVYVFDSLSAGHYVSEESSAAFTPYGLDILPTLSRACDAIEDRLKSEIAQKKALINGMVSNWKFDSQTLVGKLIANLSAKTKISDIELYSGLDEKQKQRLQDLREAFKADPLQKAKLTRAMAARLDAFAKKLETVSTELADDKLTAFKKLLDDAILSANTAKTFASGQFGPTFLKGTGEKFWNTLWSAARDYSNNAAYSDKVFPVITDGASCVLCQQELSDGAVKRLTSFESFVKDTSQELATTNEKLVVTASNKLLAINPLMDELEKIDADLTLLPADQRILLSQFTISIDERLKLIKQSFTTRVWASFPKLTESPLAFLKSLHETLEARAKMEESAHDPDTLKALVAEGAELGARDWLSGVKLDVLAQIEKYKEISKLELCRKDVTTAQITTKSSDLTKQFVTDAFQARFKAELKSLGLRTLDVVLEPVKGKKGETKFCLRLVSAGKLKVVDIASEGEQRCIALAAFLSELSQAAHQSALVFDDPVSSLDHWHRERIAERLVIEAKQRQLIVFTHDVVFLNDLLAFAEKTNVKPNVLTLEWNDGAPGYYVSGLPWDSKKPLDCLTELEQNHKSIAAKWNPQPNGANIEAMRHAYSRLRSTMERVVEVELLDGIVCRFESQVNAGRVKSLIGTTQAECDELKRLLKKCHQITDAHAPSTTTIPTPSEFMQDITDARKLITDIRARKKNTP